MSELTISVTQLNTYIKNIFDAEELLKNIKVIGEITNLKRSGSATYFDLKDETAAIPCVVFNSFLMEGFEFGDKVVIKGSPNFYVKGGRLSFVVSKIEKYGVGDLYKEFIERKEKLEKEGLFSEAHKKPLPKFVQRVGVVTSRTGAVIRDILRVKRAKNHCSDVVLYSAKVQGIGATEEIINGIKVLDSYGVDVIIVARGGGSFEDYQPFNTEEVARAVYEANTPIVSAIGHENDWSIIDFVADKRASTPSVASEMVFFDERVVLETISAPLVDFLQTRMRVYEKLYCDALNAANGVADAISQRIKSLESNLAKSAKSLIMATEHKIETQKLKLDVLKQTIQNNNPKEILSRGYVKILREGRPSKSISDLAVGDDISLIFADGEADAQIKQVKEIK